MISRKIRVPERSAAGVYRSTFQPVDQLPSARTLVSVSVICAPTDAEAEWLAGSTRLKILSRRRGRRVLLPSPEDAETELKNVDRAKLADIAELQSAGG